MRVPVIDNRGMRLNPCTSAKARILIRRGKAIPKRNEQGTFYIQLTYEHPPELPTGADPVLPEVLLDAMAAARKAAARRQACEVSGKLDRLIVIDVEATCWEHTPPDGQSSEIIEIGVCVLDLPSGERVARESILVRPENSQVSAFCTQLTTLTQEEVEQGVSFKDACAALRQRYGTSDRVWASYGDYDRRQFERQCAARGIPYPFGPTHVNVKNLLALFRGLPREVGMIPAMGLLGLDAEGTHHRGVDDAWNTALILSRLILQRRTELEWNNS